MPTAKKKGNREALAAALPLLDSISAFFLSIILIS